MRTSRPRSYILYDVRRTKRLATMLIASFGIVVVLVPMVSAAPGEPTTPADNPDLTKACGLDVLMILDESGSIATLQRHR